MSTHSLGFSNVTTYPLGYAVPTACRLMTPRETIKGKFLDNFRLDPLGYPVMDNLDAHSSWYFVPLEMLYSEFADFLRQAVRTAPNQAQDTLRKNFLELLPWIPYGWNLQDDLHATTDLSYLTTSQLNQMRLGYNSGTGVFDQLKLRVPSVVLRNGNTIDVSRPAGPDPLSTSLRLSAFPFLAYHKIMDDWFCDEEMEFKSANWPISILQDRLGNELIDSNTRTYAPLLDNNMINPTYWSAIRGERQDVGDAVAPPNRDNGFLLRRANWRKDLLTTRRPNPQIGEAELLPSDGTIDDLREATAIQNLKLSQQGTAAFLTDFYKREYGVEGYSSSFGRCIHIASADHTVGLDISDILQTSETTSNSPQANPVGYSRTARDGYFEFTAQGFGILMRITRVVPRTLYHYGIDPIWLRTSPYDYFSPKLRGIGWQPIPRAVVVSHAPTAPSSSTPTPSASELGTVTGWQPPWEYDRNQLSYTAGGFNILNGLVDVSAYTFGRDYSLESDPWIGQINAQYRKADVTLRPFAVTTQEPTQVQHFADYDFSSHSLIPKAINHRDTLH